jgi:carbon storage regulator
MLVLSRRIGEEIVIDDNIHVAVLGVKGNQVRLGITAPISIPVSRLELHSKPTGFENEKGLPVPALGHGSSALERAS